MEEMDIVLREIEDVNTINEWEAETGTEILKEWRRKVGNVLEMEKNEIGAYLQENFTGWRRDELTKFIKRLISGSIQREKQMINCAQTMEKMDEKFRWITFMKATMKEQKEELEEARRTAAETEDILEEQRKENNRKAEEIWSKEEHIEKLNKEVKKHMEKEKELWSK